jgi:hypothetical protein
MALAQFARSFTIRKIIFWGAWIVVFAVALLASVLEVSYGNTCPKSSAGIAMCYASLIISILIALLFCIKQRSFNPSPD